MARPYGDKFLRDIHANKQDSLGVALGLLCIENNVAATHIAVALAVTRTTVYSWFRGQGIRESKRRDVEGLIAMLSKDAAEGRLPVADAEESKTYVEELCGIKI